MSQGTTISSLARPERELHAEDEKHDDAKSVSQDDDEVTMVDHTRRTLKSRHIQLIGIGGAIGTSLFVQIGFVLPKGGPASLFLAFVLWTTVVVSVNNCLEMVTWIPISSPFIRFSDRFVDPALGFCVGINYFIFLAILVPFEITAFDLIIHFWTDQIPTAAVITFVIVCYVLLNVFAVRYYGESEFWLALGKVILAVGLIFFTFITMVGGNPLHDKFGFRNWNPSKVPGTPFVAFVHEGSLGRFMGFLSCLIQASFTVCGPEYLSMAAGEAENPRKVLPRAYKHAYGRMATFFVLGALSIGILLPYTDPSLANALSDPKPGAGSSPYVIAMQNMNIHGLSHVVNVLIMLSVFSAGNSYVFCASRSLYGLALEGRMPRFLTRCTEKGVPVYCVACTLAVSLLAFLQVSNGSAKVLGWFVDLTTASQVLNYAFISFTYLRFHKALKAHSISRDTLPYSGPWQPFCAYYGLFFTSIMTFMAGYSVFLPGNWDVPTFLFSYAVIGILPFCFVYWKFAHHSNWLKPYEVTFFDDERRLIDEYESSFLEKPLTSRWEDVKRWTVG